MHAESRKHVPRKNGRPKGDPIKVRHMTIGVRVNPAEWQTLQLRARHMGMSPAQWLRTAALSRRMPPPPVPEVNRKTYGELARLGVNLNQIAKAANAGRTAVPFGLLRELLRAIMCLQASLMGVADSMPPVAEEAP